MRKTKNAELNRLSVGDFKKAPKLPVVVVLDNVRSTHNVGSVFRTADAFRIEKIILCGITAVPPHRDIYKTALGATESVDWSYEEDTAEAVGKLKEEGYRIVAVEQADEHTYLDEFRPEPAAKLALIFGHEVTGIQEEVMALADGCIEIPQAGTKHSLNISVTVGIVLWEISGRLSGAKDHS
ncbi:MAG: RNA methyltransferase [Bacteroidales bacterium]|nr:RNA methyltransferase [Lentimicrobiaceae bacterium]MDD5696056.1 RNA methyltransferase [Bacteroidales bacterium]